MGSIAEKINPTICITTRNRPKAFTKVMESIIRHTDGFAIIVVDDASDDPYTRGIYGHRFEERQGIPAAKNKCLELAMDMGAEHIFLFDDDCYPIKDGWEQEYINAGINHLCFTFLPSYKRKGKFKMHTLGNGCMMYVNRKCIETIGGFDWRFGMGKYEHVNFSRRIHNAGLTPYVFMDLINSHELLHSMDKGKEIKRSFNDTEIKTLLRSGSAHFARTANSSEYIDYRPVPANNRHQEARRLSGELL